MRIAFPRGPGYDDFMGEPRRTLSDASFQLAATARSPFGASVDAIPVVTNAGTRPALSQTPIGQRYIYSHDNMPVGHLLRGASCGQAGVASMLDYWDVNPYRLPRVPTKLARDGRLHFPDELTGRVLADYPPANVFGIRFTVRETIIGALRKNGFTVDESYAEFNGDGSFERDHLVEWLTKHPKIPLICLLGLADAETNRDGWYESLHWGLIHAVSATTVWMASWHKVVPYTWAQFMAAWHCRLLPYPNNYYAIHAWR